VCAHPDDESFGLGAVISTFTERQTLVDLVCLTHGETSTLGAANERTLGPLRTAELAAATRELGIGRVEVADFPDGSLATVPATQLASFIASLTIGADALLVFDENGITGHPDHQAATAAALVVAHSLDVTVLAWTIPATVARIVNHEFGTTFIGRPDDQIDVSIAVDRTRQRRAIACHTSQLRDNPVPHRRLALTGDTEYLRYLRRADHQPASHAEHPSVRPRAS
jgi:LmbE family N-acetylglucosaminyl deacetylase